MGVIASDATTLRRLARWLPSGVLALLRQLDARGYGAAIVGGAIRDAYLGRVVIDWDVATDASVSAVAELFRRVVPVGGAFGTVLVMTGSGPPVQVSTLRGSGAGDTFAQRLEDDLACRDLTINAMAFVPRLGQLVDPFGGAADLRRGVLRAVGSPAARLSEDPLRALRVLRLQAVLGMRIEPSTAAVLHGAAPSCGRLAWERKRDELMRLLAAGSGPDLGRALGQLRTTGLLAVVAPELAAAPASAMRAAAAWPGTQAELRLALWGATARLSAASFTSLLQRWRLSNRQQRRVAAVAAALSAAPAAPFKAAALRWWVFRYGASATLDAATLASSWARSPRQQQAYRALRARLLRVIRSDPCLRPEQLAVRARELRSVLGIEGRALGRLIDGLMALVLDKPRLNRRAILLDRAAQLSTGCRDNQYLTFSTD